MVLSLPNAALSLGHNLDVPVPAIFKGASHLPLDSFIKEYDPCPPGTSQCAARDWTDLMQRMHYVLHLFRAFAEDTSLFARPFTEEQIARFRAGAIPEGEL